MVDGFKMSDKTKEELLDSLKALLPHERVKVLGAISSLCAEVEMFCVNKTLERLRQEWGNTLQTMFLIEPEPKKS